MKPMELTFEGDKLAQIVREHIKNQLDLTDDDVLDVTWRGNSREPGSLEITVRLKPDAKLYVQLRALIEQGNGDSKKADDLRDRMDAPWREMTAEERRAFL
jgi:hypothetical protein